MAKRVLALDVGNSHIFGGLFVGDEPVDEGEEADADALD